MKMIPVKLIVQLSLGILLIFSGSVFSDQTDKRLDELFSVLQSSEDQTELQTIESSIWEIWFDSGKPEIDLLMEEAGSAVQAGKLAYAEGLYSQVIEKLPDFSEGWNRRATVRFYQNDYAGSLEDIQRTLILEPRHFGATWGLGMILGSQRDLIGAIAAFERLLEIKPGARDAKPRLEMLKQELAKSAV
jgi:tetratricopeptide (TPR) repeat protein